MHSPQPKSFVALLIIVSLLVIAGTGNSSSLASTSEEASSDNQDEKAVWVRYSAKAEEFSVLMPALPGVISGKTCMDLSCQTVRLEKTYAAYADGVVYVVTSYQNPKRRQSLEAVVAENLGQLKERFTIVSQSDVTLNKFEGKRYVLTSKPGEHHRIVTFYITDKYVYLVDAVGDTANDASMKKFFESFALDNQKATEIGNGAKQITSSVNNPLRATTSQDGQSVKPGQTPETSKRPVWSGTGTGVNLNQGGGVGPGRGGNVGGGDLKSGQTPAMIIFKPSEVTRKALFVLKPSPEYTEKARRELVTGRVVLQVVLSSTGSVVNIRTISGLPHGLTENAIRAARAIYFVPAMKDGQRVSQYVKVEYNFNIY